MVACLAPLSVQVVHLCPVFPVETTVEFLGEHGNLPEMRKISTGLTGTITVTTVQEGNKVPAPCSNRGNCGTLWNAP